MSPASAAILASVKTFWTILPVRSPVVLDHVNNNSTPTATKVAGVSLNRPKLARTWVSESCGARTPRNFANATATAAMVPVWMTRNRVQP